MSKDLKWFLSFAFVAILTMAGWGFSKISEHDQTIPKIATSLQYIEKQLDTNDAKTNKRFDALGKKMDRIDNKLPCMDEDD